MYLAAVTVCLCLYHSVPLWPPGLNLFRAMVILLLCLVNANWTQMSVTGTVPFQLSRLFSICLPNWSSDVYVINAAVIPTAIDVHGTLHCHC